MRKDCTSCDYYTLDVDVYPCCSCVAHSNHVDETNSGANEALEARIAELEREHNECRGQISDLTLRCADLEKLIDCGDSDCGECLECTKAVASSVIRMQGEHIDRLNTALESACAEVEQLKRKLRSAQIGERAWQQQCEQLAADRERWMRDSDAEAAALVENAESLHAKAIDQLGDVTGERDRALAEVERLTREAQDARRSGRAEGLREAAEILKKAAEADASNAVHCSAPNHRERLQRLSENELVMAQRMLTRAEEVERE